MKSWYIALLSATCLAVAHPHDHAHRHAVRDGSPVEDRDVVTTTVAGPTVTFYKLGNDLIDYADVEAGLRNHKYIIEGEAIASVEQPPASESSTPSPTSVAQSSSSSSTTSAVLSPAHTAPAPPKAPVSSAKAAPTATSTHGSGNIDAEFPGATIPCSQFPSEYGAIYIDWLDLAGWTGIQSVPGYEFGVSKAIVEINSVGECTENSFCSYACPPGYQKSQWPEAQGSTGQTIGGLYCNSNGMLELSRSSVPQICTPGVGNIYVENQLSKNVAICRTDYPGLEAETIPLDTQPQNKYPLTCPDSSEYFLSRGRPTTAQYYINPAGTPVEKACQWGSGGNTGNWAPVNVGVGRDDSGETFISIFPNHPTNPDGNLDFSITILGGVSGDCSYKSGKYWNNGAESDTGCTVAITGAATFIFS